MAVARVGDAFIDALADYIHWDDRGVCFALWKYRPKAAVGASPGLAFRFDFLVEADLAPARGILSKRPHLTAESLRRQADQLFPPIIQTVWLGENLKPLPDDASSVTFREPYDKGQGGQHGRDYNVNHERWEILSKDYPPAKWKTLCDKARKAAESVLRDQLQLKDLTREKAEQAAKFAAIRIAQQESRIAHLPLASRKEEKAQLKLDELIAAAIEEGIREPAIRLDAIGAVFVSRDRPCSCRRWKPEPHWRITAEEAVELKRSLGRGPKGEIVSHPSGRSTLAVGVRAIRRAVCQCPCTNNRDWPARGRGRSPWPGRQPQPARGQAETGLPCG